MKKISSEKLSALAKVIKQARHLGDVEWIRTGIHALDLMIGGGIPLGRTIEIFGSEQAGKSLLAWAIAKVFQEAGGVVQLFDVEATAPKDFMNVLGVKTDEVMLPDADINTVEDFRDEQKKMVDDIRAVDKDVPILTIVDSIAALTSRGEYEDEEKMVTKDHTMGAKAQELSKYFRQHTIWMKKNNVTLIGVNQLRDKIGVMFGRKEDSPGGRAFKFHSSVRIELSQGKRLDIDGETTGVICHAKIQKNKMASPFRKTDLRIAWGKGFEPYSGLIPILAEARRLKEEKGGFLIDGKKYKDSQIEEAVKDRPELIADWLVK